MDRNLSLFQGANDVKPLVPRTYQLRAVDKLRELLRQHYRRIMLCSPTGSGKSVIATIMLRSAVDRGKRVAFLVDRVALVDQMSETLHLYGIGHGVARGGTDYGARQPVHVWSMQTLERRDDCEKILAGYDLIVWDEAHEIRKRIAKAIIESNVPTIGLSATPFRTGLGSIYETVVNVRSTDQLIRDGYLSPFKIYCGEAIDASTVETGSNGEITTATAARAARGVVGNVVPYWHEMSQKIFGYLPQTFMFTPTIAEGLNLVREFNTTGVRAAQIGYRDRVHPDAVDGDYEAARQATDDERRNTIDDFKSRNLTLLSSCEALGRGVDVPEVECIIELRIYKRGFANVVQHLGRGQRVAEGKKFCLVLDYAMNILRFENRLLEFWANGVSSLDPAALNFLNRKVTDEEEEEAKERVCKGCGMALPPGADACPSCGLTVRRKRSATKYLHGTLEEWKRPFDDVSDIWPHICRFAEDRYPDDIERAQRFARRQFQVITGKWPAWGRPFKPGEKCDARIDRHIRDGLRSYARKQAIIKAKRRKQGERIAS